MNILSIEFLRILYVWMGCLRMQYMPNTVTNQCNFLCTLRNNAEDINVPSVHSRFFCLLHLNSSGSGEQLNIMLSMPQLRSTIVKHGKNWNSFLVYALYTVQWNANRGYLRNIMLLVPRQYRLETKWKWFIAHVFVYCSKNLFSAIETGKKSREFDCQECFWIKMAQVSAKKNFSTMQQFHFFCWYFAIFQIVVGKRQPSNRQRASNSRKLFFLFQFLCYTLFSLFFHRRMRIFPLSPEQLWQLTPDFGFISVPCVQRTQYFETGNFLCTQYSCYSCGN